MSERSTRTRTPAVKRAGALLCALLVSGGAIELHDRNHRHRDFQLAQLLEEGASHPGIPHHFDSSDERREAPCATCAREAQSRGVEPAPTGRIAPAAQRFRESLTSCPTCLPRISSAASPRGPPAA